MVINMIDNRFEQMRSWILNLLQVSEGIDLVAGPIERWGKNDDHIGFTVTFKTADFGTCHICALEELIVTSLVVDNGVHVVQYDLDKKEHFYMKGNEKVIIPSGNMGSREFAMKIIEQVFADGKERTAAEVAEDLKDKALLDQLQTTAGLEVRDPMVPSVWAIAPDAWTTTDETMSVLLEFFL